MLFKTLVDELLESIGDDLCGVVELEDFRSLCQLAVQLKVFLLDLLVFLLERKQRDDLIEGDLRLLSLCELVKLI